MIFDYLNWIGNELGDLFDFNVFCIITQVSPSTMWTYLQAKNFNSIYSPETLTEEERRNQQYVEDENIAQPSVITLNVKSAEQAVNDFMMMFTGLYKPEVKLHH